MTEQEYLGGLGLCKRATATPTLEDTKAGVEDLKNAVGLITHGVSTMRPLVERSRRVFGDKEPTLGSRGRAAGDFFRKRIEDAGNKKDWDNAKGAFDDYARYANDIMDEAEASDFASRLRLAGPSYALSGLGGAGVGAGIGALVGGPKHRGVGAVTGGTIGGVAGLLANYLRRKSYYGDTIQF